MPTPVRPEHGTVLAGVKATPCQRRLNLDQVSTVEK